MQAIVTNSYVQEKYALVNFSIGGYTDSAIAFPLRYVDNVSVPIPFDEFIDLLGTNKTICVRWSKKLCRYVVRF